MKKLINWLKETPVFENLKKRVFLTRVRLFPEYRKKVLKKDEVEKRILLEEAQNEINQYIKTNAKESNFEIFQKISNDFVFSISLFGFFTPNYNTIKNELKKLDKHEKLEFLKDLENYLRIAFKKEGSKIINEIQNNKQIYRIALKKKDSDENFNMLYHYSKIDENDIIKSFNEAIEWIKAKKIEYTTPGYENFDSYGLIERIITNSYDLNDVIFIVKDTFQKVKNKKEYKLWITAILKERIQSFKEIIQSMEKNKVIMNHRYANSSNRLEFALKTINELDINENNDISNTETILDYSDNKYPERIVFMYELGIIEYLRNIPPFNTSTNKLAEVLSTFTGIKQSTLQSYINPILSKDVDKKKSPLNEKNLKTVREKLLNIGYIPKNNLNKSN